jgi:hypothetical protein
MKIARRLLALVILAAMFAPVGGCGVGSTWDENKRTIARSYDYDKRMLVDDLGLLIQVDRPRRTSRWVID